MWKRKAELFRFSDWALLFLFAKFFSRQCRTEGQTSLSFWLCRGVTRKEICQSFFFKVGQRARLVCLPASVESSFEEKVHSQSALVHKLMRSGFFICQNFWRRQAEVSETLPQGLLTRPGCLKDYSSKRYVLPTAPSVPRRSPIQVLTRLNAA